MTVDCDKFNDYLFRRTPNWDRELAKDRFPHSYLYTTMYSSKTWPPFTGTTHTWDRVHVTRPNDDGCWEAMDADPCITNICDPTPRFLGWGSTRSTYTKYHQDYRTPVFCLDQLRHVEMAREQLHSLVNGLKMLPEEVWSDFIRMLALRQCETLHICGSSLSTVTITDDNFLQNCLVLDLGGAANLPTSKLSMDYLDNHVEALRYNGYDDNEFAVPGKFFCTTDITTLRDLANKNPALTQMYNSADFAKGGSFYQFGVMKGVGDWLFKIDKAPMRFDHIGDGKLRRIWPYENVATTVGKKPEFSDQYKAAQYQLFHVYNRAAREVYVGDITSVNDSMRFGMARSFMGKWNWRSPDYFDSFDINTGTTCQIDNHKHNKGFFEGEFEGGMKTMYPEIEMLIIAEREAQPVVNVPRVAADVELTTYQSLTPYNTLCEDA